MNSFGCAWVRYLITLFIFTLNKYLLSYGKLLQVNKYTRS